MFNMPVSLTVFLPLVLKLTAFELLYTSSESAYIDQAYNLGKVLGAFGV